jgi:hypothetical protein
MSTILTITIWNGYVSSVADMYPHLILQLVLDHHRFSQMLFLYRSLRTYLVGFHFLSLLWMLQ